MLYLGVDPHKDNHVISTINDSSNYLSSKTIKADLEGYKAALEWSKEQSSERLWGIENPQSYGRGFAQYLVSKGEKVLSVPPHLTGLYRRRSSSRGKTDRNDSLAVSRAILQEKDKLQQVLEEKETEILKILLEHYDNLKSEKNRSINRLHAHLGNLEIKESLNLTSKRALKYVLDKCNQETKTPAGARWLVVKSLAERTLEIIEELKHIDKHLIELLTLINPEPILEIEGLGNYCAAKILSIVGTPLLFRKESEFANYAGVAPISCSSGKNVKYRVNPGGNRQLNSIIYQVMITQLRSYDPAKEYYQRKQSEGKTSKEALRCLKRMITRRIFSAMKQIEYFKTA